MSDLTNAQDSKANNNGPLMASSWVTASYNGNLFPSWNNITGYPAGKKASIATGTRDSSIGLLRVGNNYNSAASTNSNFKIKLLSIKTS